MSETAEPQRRMTNAEFFAWCETQEEPYELVDGIPVPLGGARRTPDTGSR